MARSVVTGYCISGKRKEMRLERKQGSSHLGFEFEISDEKFGFHS